MIVKIDHVLKRKKRTRYWLSKKIGVEYANISRLANNQTTSVKFKIIDDICSALECEIHEILEVQKNEKLKL